jgi:hypothetical protein
MAASEQKRIVRLRAAALAFMLALGSLCAPVALATQSSDICSMTCCVQEGHCCCKPARRFVEGNLPDGTDRMEKAVAWARCPEGCAALGSSSFSLRITPRTESQSLVLIDSITVEPRQAVFAHSVFESGPSCPRAPPLLSI